MAYVALFTRDRATDHVLTSGLERSHELVKAGTWARLFWLVRERPVTLVVVDGAVLPPRGATRALGDLLELFPSVGTLLVTRGALDARTLFELGRAGLEDLVLLSTEGVVCDVGRAAMRALSGGTAAAVTRTVSPALPRRELAAARLALEAPLRGWDTEQLATRVGLSRPHLSVRLRSAGLPSAGKLLTWARMLHAGTWLTDPGRTAESVSRQLGYSSGSAFRRALRNYVGGTPTELIANGGFTAVLESFVEACDLAGPSRLARSVA